jgi:type II secretory pathway component GspD/PulD (secretin)
VLIGGLREALTRERRAEVPVLGSIPLTSFFFKQEGVADENNALMVLVRATITDIKDATEAR